MPGYNYLIITGKKKIRKKNKYKGIDLYIFCSVLVLVAIGIIMVFSASYYDALYKHKNVFYFLVKRLKSLSHKINDCSL